MKALEDVDAKDESNLSTSGNFVKNNIQVTVRLSRHLL